MRVRFEILVPKAGSYTFRVGWAGARARFELRHGSAEMHVEAASDPEACRSVLAGMAPLASGRSYVEITAFSETVLDFLELARAASNPNEPESAGGMAPAQLQIGADRP